jgi:hypothetical protein
MRSLGVHRESITTLSSNTNSHDQSLSIQREKAKNNVRTNMIKKVGHLDSSQRTSMISSDVKGSVLTRTDFSNTDINVVKSALNRVRNSGCIPPKKK